MALLTNLAILSIILIILIFLMKNYKYIIEKIRKIAEEPSGYFKFGQVIILFFAIFSFLSILFYNMFIDTRDVSAIDVSLTVIVGVLGTIIGLFFGAKAEQYITEPRKDFVRIYRDRIQYLINKVKELVIKTKELEEENERLKKS